MYFDNSIEVTSSRNKLGFIEPINYKDKYELLWMYSVEDGLQQDSVLQHIK